jgi:hypothetical protein
MRNHAFFSQHPGSSIQHHLMYSDSREVQVKNDDPKIVFLNSIGDMGIHGKIFGVLEFLISTGFLKNTANIEAKKLNLPFPNILDTFHVLGLDWICDGNRLYLSAGANESRINSPRPA